MYFPWIGKRKREGRRSGMQSTLNENRETREVEIRGLGVMKVARSVNCIGDGCPKPQLLTLKALNQLPEGSVVELISDNPTAVETIPSMMMAAYGSHLATIRDDSYWKVYVRKGI